MPAPATPASAPRLSALDGWIDVLRAGSFVDKSGRAFTVSAEDLSAIATDYATSDPAPVTIGHPESDAAPAWGWVEKLRAVGDRLQAKLGRLDDSFRAACEAGRYAARSVAITPPSQNLGWTLWHLAFLGGAAPAVDGLVPVAVFSNGCGPSGRVFSRIGRPFGRHGGAHRLARRGTDAARPARVGHRAVPASRLRTGFCPTGISMT
ncbi:hypothetical protein [Tateyamaria sp.]|uniref:hypothetical protein n=1 Tax=Tateyamaria sp. TaxID=1929288 RepID=UPI003B216B46